MKKLLFKTLYLFSPHEKLGKRILFSEGINVFTSNIEDGTKRGKSVIMRSLYHTLGADALFEKKWEVENKVFILEFSIDGSTYYMYRTADLFKLFDSEKRLLFSVVNRTECMEKLAKLFGFAVMLPNRSSDELVLTPPVYNYLPFYIDQDCYDGSQYTSFKNLGQFADFKCSVIYYHIGVYNEDYFSLVKDKDRFRAQRKEKQERRDIVFAMIADVNQKLEVGAVSGDMDSLRKDVEQYREEYVEIQRNLAKCRNTLINLRNECCDIEQLLRELVDLSKKSDKEISSLRAHKCPECGSVITDTVLLKSKRYNLEEDITIVKNDLQISLQSVLRKIESEEEKYAQMLGRLNEYDHRLSRNTAELNDILRYRGLCELRDEIVREIAELNDCIDKYDAELKKIAAEIRKYGEKKKEANELYYQLLLQAKNLFGLSEIKDDKFKNIENVFGASGSSKNIATVIWYLTILRLRQKFNPDAIVFPMVFDSPNNVETDNEKRYQLLQYIFEKAASHQVIVSSLGFKAEEFPIFQISVTDLTNERYKLLDSESFERYSGLLTELCDAGIE